MILDVIYIPSITPGQPTLTLFITSGGWRYVLAAARAPKPQAIWRKGK